MADIDDIQFEVVPYGAVKEETVRDVAVESKTTVVSRSPLVIIIVVIVEAGFGRLILYPYRIAL